MAEDFFLDGPSGRGMSPQSFVRSALEDPLGLGEQLSTSFIQGTIDSPALGTVVRELYAPDKVTPEYVWDRNAGRERFETEDEMAQRTGIDRDEIFDEEQYQASEFFREQVPWVRGMTRDRAKALAEMADAQDVRRFYSSKRPIAAFFGGLAGAATDPINYIPVIGPTARAATAARLGAIRGAALTSSGDAVINTAAALAATAPIRGQFGDDISIEAFAQDLAIAAIIGGAFGTITGAFGKRPDSRLIAKAQDELATMEVTQKGVVMLNDAIDGIVRNDRVDMSTASMTFGDSVANLAMRLDLEMRPGDVIDMNAKAADPQAFARLEDVDRLLAMNTAQRAQLDEAISQPQNMSVEESIDRLDALTDQYEDLTARAAAEPDEATQQNLRNQADRVGQEIADLANATDENGAERLRRNQQDRDDIQSTIESLQQERTALEEKVETARKRAENEYWKGREEDAADAEARADLYRLFPDLQDQIIERPQLTSPDEVSTAATKPADRRGMESNPDPEAQPVDRPETFRETEVQRNVTEDGSYVEEPEIEDLRQRGLLTEEDEASLTEADAEYNKTRSFAETMERMVACLF